MAIAPGAKKSITLHLEGIFDGRAALDLRESIEQLADHEVVIDFSRVRQFFDLAVPIFTRGLSHPSLQLRGLMQHPERVFRAFGLRVEAAPPRGGDW